MNKQVYCYQKAAVTFTIEDDKKILTVDAEGTVLFNIGDFPKVIELKVKNIKIDYIGEYYGCLDCNDLKAIVQRAKSALVKKAVGVVI